MSVGAIIFSRYDSSRLPGKALADIDGRTLLGRVIDRTKKIKNIKKIIVATSNRDIDDQIYNFTLNEDVECYRGNFKNVASRAIQVCKKYKLESFARICGDRPFFDPYIVSYLINKHQNIKSDLTTTVGTRQIPPGLTGEIVSTNSLKNSYHKFDKYEQEHLTTYFYKNSNQFLINNIFIPNYIQYDKRLRLVVDDYHDLKRAKWIALRTRNIKVDNKYMEKVFFWGNEWEKNNLKDNNEN